MTGDENASITIWIVTFFIETVKRSLGSSSTPRRGDILSPSNLKPRTENREQRTAPLPLNLMNQITFETGIRETVAWYLTNQPWVSSVNQQASGK